MHHESISPRCASSALREASRAVSRVYDAALADRGMSISQFAILRHLDRGGPLALSRLAEQLVMDRTSLYRALGPIEVRGWVSVAAGPGRSRLASLTSAGRAAMLGAEPAWREAQARIVGGIGEEGWSALQTALGAVTALAQRAGR